MAVSEKDLPESTRRWALEEVNHAADRAADSDTKFKRAEHLSASLQKYEDRFIRGKMTGKAAPYAGDLACKCEVVSGEHNRKHHPAISTKKQMREVLLPLIRGE